MAGAREITAEEIISKLKDDGDFDKLRIKIIRKLKDNEELRNSITEVVKQSAALDRPGAENMKPRELADLIHEEVREKVMCQISDGLWEIIRSADGMKTEITDVVQSVYDKLNPSAKMEDQSASLSHALPIQEITPNSPTQLSDGQLKDSTGLYVQSHNCDEQLGRESEHPGPGDIQPTAEVGVPSQAPGQVDEDPSPPPRFLSNGKHKELSDGSDDDLDAPPGFG